MRLGIKGEARGCGEVGVSSKPNYETRHRFTSEPGLHNRQKLYTDQWKKIKSYIFDEI